MPIWVIRQPVIALALAVAWQLKLPSRRQVDNSSMRFFSHCHRVFGADNDLLGQAELSIAEFGRTGPARSGATTWRKKAFTLIN